MTLNLATARLADAPEAAQLLALPELGHDKSVAPLTMQSNPLMAVKARVQVCVGEAQVPVGDLVEAKVGFVVQLDRPADGPVDLLVEGRVVARGELVAVGDHFGVRITELPLPLKA